MKCNDQSMKYLKAFGYNVIRLPRADIKPLQILMKDGSTLEPLGDISELLIEGANRRLPSITADTPTASISGKRTSDLSLDIGLNILGNVISAMGGNSVGLNAQYSNARTIAFQFNDVLTDSAPIIKIDQFLSDAGSDPFSKHLKTLLEDDRIYLITATIKSKALSVEATKQDKTALEVDASAMKQLLGPNVKVSTASTRSSTITYAGDEHLVFGFKAIKLVYKKGKYVSFDPVKEGTFVSDAVDSDFSENKGAIDESDYKWLNTGDELVDFGYE